MLSRINV